MILRGYIDEAMFRQKAKSYSELARLLGLNRAMVSFMYSEKSLPSDETMIKLAELAGMPKEEALIDLNIWRAKNNPELQKVWIRLSKMIGCFAVFPLIMLMIPHGVTFTTLGALSLLCCKMAAVIALFLLIFYFLTKYSKMQVYEITKFS